MIPISPAGRHQPDTRSLRPDRAPARDGALASRHRPLASLSAPRAEERAAIRRSFLVAAALLALLITGAAISVALAPGQPDMIARID